MQHHTSIKDNGVRSTAHPALEHDISFSELQLPPLNIIVLEIESQSFPCEHHGDI